MLRQWLREAGFVGCRSRSIGFLPTRWHRFAWTSRALLVERFLEAAPLVRHLGGLALASGMKPV